MEFWKVISKRKMIRSFKNKAIPKAKIERIIEAMFKGPSAGFSQGMKIMVLDNQKSKELFFSQWGGRKSRLISNPWKEIENADIIILVFVSKLIYINRYQESDKKNIKKK